jgi:uncharacterized peroxidase-related enzyme
LSHGGRFASGPYLRAVEYSAANFPPFAFFQEQFGFIPNIFRAQTLRPDVLEAEAGVIRAVLLTKDLLSRVQKERILLVISAANLNTYCVAVHCEMLRALGVSEEDSDQIAVDHNQTDLSEADKALLDFALKLAVRPSEFQFEDVNLLRRQGLGEERMLEGVVMTALTNFLNTLQMGLGTIPDFTPKRVFTPKDLYPSVKESRPMSDVAVSQDPDTEVVRRVQAGDVDAFEELVRHHSRRVFGILAGLLGNMDDIRDVTQDVFLKAFEHIGSFRGGRSFQPGLQASRLIRARSFSAKASRWSPWKKRMMRAFDLVRSRTGQRTLSSYLRPPSGTNWSGQRCCAYPKNIGSSYCCATLNSCRRKRQQLHWISALLL